MNPLQQLLAALQGNGQPQSGYVPAQDMSAYAPQMHPMAPQMPAQTQGASYGMSAPQTPQSAPAANSGGGIGGFLENLVNPGASKKNQTVQWLTSQGMDPGMAQIVASDRGMLQRYLVQRSQGQKHDYQFISTPDGQLARADKSTGDIMPIKGFSKPADLTPSDRFKLAQQYGIDPKSPEGKQFILTGKMGSGVTVNNNMGSNGIDYGQPEKGYAWARNPDGSVKTDERGAPIAVAYQGGSAWQKSQEAAQKDAGRLAELQRAGTTVTQDLGRAILLLPKINQDKGVVGAGARLALAAVPGTPEYQISQFIESAKSNIGLDRLQQMRQNSPTGGALGQVPFQQQQRLEQVLGSMALGQDPEVIDTNIKRIMNIYLDTMFGTDQERAQAVKEGKMTQQQSDYYKSLHYDVPMDIIGRPTNEKQGQAAKQSRLGADVSKMSDEELHRIINGQ